MHSWRRKEKIFQNVKTCSDSCDGNIQSLLGWEDRIARDEKNEELKSQIKFVSLKCKLSCIFPVEGFNTFLLTTNGNNIINF